jgi:histidine triad (HIT) family protein
MSSSPVTLDNVFAKIVAGELPCHRLHEDALTLAFLDLNPLSVGHTLLIPKRCVLTVDALTDQEAAALGCVMPRLVRAICTATGAQALNILQNNGAAAGQVVRHVHFHLIPKHADGSGLSFAWPKGELTAPTALASAIRAAL